MLRHILWQKHSTVRPVVNLTRFLDALSSLGSMLVSQWVIFLRVGQILGLSSGYIQGRVRVCSGYVQGMFRQFFKGMQIWFLLQSVIFLKYLYTPFSKKIIYRCVQVMFRVFSGYIRGMFRVCSGYVQGMFRVYSGYIQGMFRVC